MIHRPDPECDRFAEALLDFVERRPPRPDTPAALRHLERCPSCEQEVAAMTLVVTGLRRLGAAGRAIDPPVDGWERVERRVAEPAHVRPGAWRIPLRERLTPLAVAMVAPVLLAVLLVVPAASSLEGGALNTGDANVSGSAAASSAAVAATSGPVLVGDDLAMGGGRAIVQGAASELEDDSSAPVVTPVPSPVPQAEPQQLPLRAVPLRNTGVGPM